MGIHAGDHAIYPDCRQEFRDADFEAFKSGNWGAEKVYHYTPYLSGDKYTILEDGASCCECLGLDFNEVYSRTNTSYKPILIETPTIYYNFDNPDRGTEVKTEGTREWYSDYKSASSVERVEAFIKLGKPDPVAYADETGPVSWDTVVEHVEKILKEHKN
jgi:7-cyano-7-deazaguanine synthase